MQSRRYRKRWIFQFTPLREGRPSWMHRRRRIMYFNSRPSARGDYCVRLCHVIRVYFNSRPSARGDAICTHLQQFQKYFNSRPSARGDWGNWVRKIKTIDISIHAPPRGATNTYGAISYYVIFQFTPLREGRRRKFWAAVVSFVFQFTPLREGRRRSR